MIRGRRATVAAILTAALLTSTAALAEVATDGTLGRKVRLTGKEVEVGAELGKIRGKNLFHSFERFGVETKGKVTFTGPKGLDNVISRVTGGEASRIDGTLASRVEGADVYLVNPTGIVFGPNARLDVPASFYASTADELRFADGAVFSTLDPAGSVLTVAAPEAFGFLSAGRAGIGVDGASLTAGAGETISLIGGAIRLDASLLGTVGGTVLVTGLDGVGSVDLASGSVDRDLSGTVDLTTDSVIIAAGEGGGQIFIRAGRLRVLDGSSVFSSTVDRDTDHGITVEAGEILVSGSGSVLGVNAIAAGSPGPLLVQAGSVTLRDGGGLSGLTGGGGNGADVRVRAGKLVVDGGRVESDAVASSTAARTGDVTVNAKEVLVLREGRISSSTLSTTDAGRVRVVADRVDLRSGGRIAAETFAEGDAGSIEVEAGRLIIDEGASANAITGISSSATGGTAGTVSVRARELEIGGTGAIISETFGPGAAGDLRVVAGDLRIRPAGVISTATGSAAPAGEVVINAERLSIDGRGSDRLTGIVSASAATGPAGGINITARELAAERGLITTAGVGAEGGRIAVVANEVIVLDDSRITSSGIVPAEGASLISVRAPLIALNRSRVTSLTGDGEPLTGSGEARLLGDVTVISTDSLVAASSTVETTGVQTDIGSSLQVSAGAFLDADSLLGTSCAARRAGQASSFTRVGRGGLPPSPDRPLASGVERETAQALRVGSGFLVASGMARRPPSDGCGPRLE